MRNVIIREMRAGEEARVGELRVSAYQAQDLLAPESGYTETLRGFGFGGRCTVLVADDETGGLLGTVAYEPYGPDSELAQDEAEAEIRAFAVDARAQGQGIGAALLRAVTGYAAGHGIRTLRLCTQPPMLAAQHLYAKAGFTRTPEHDFEPAPGVVLRAYELPLAAG